MIAQKPNHIIAYVRPDGRLTPEGMKLLERIVAAIQAAEDRISTLEGFH